MLLKYLFIMKLTSVFKKNLNFKAYFLFIRQSWSLKIVSLILFSSFLYNVTIKIYIYNVTISVCNKDYCYGHKNIHYAYFP